MRTNVNGCRLTGPIRTKAPDTEATVRAPGGSQGALLTGAAKDAPLSLFTFKEWRDLCRTRLTRPLRGLLPRLTGLRLHVLWHRPTDFQGAGRALLLCPRARRRAGARGRQPERCKRCLKCRWHPALSPGSQGRRFAGRCGATNFCACLMVDKVCPLTLVLQARVRAGGSVSVAAVNHAVVLARLILHDLASTAQARLASSRLDTALGRLTDTQVEAGRLRAELRRCFPGLPQTTVQPGLGNRARKLVAAMRDFVHQHYHRPIGLSDVASAMRMNGSYLSALFSQTAGVTFHHFLEEVRLSKAKELLRDPCNRVGEVACAAGYASPDAFRHAFKAREGLAPGAWRTGQ